REVTYESVLKRPRQNYHAKVADWLIENSRDRESEYLGLIADHLVKAGRSEQAIGYLQKAGQEAAARYGNDEALEFFNQAIDLAEQSTLEDTNRASLYRARGLVHEKLGDFEAARSDFENTLRLARATGELKGEWRALLDLGKIWASRDYGKTHDYFEEALELARQIDDPALLARSLNRMGNWYVNADCPPEAISYHQEAMMIFEQSGDRSGMARTLDLLGMVNTLSGDLLARNEYYDRAIELFRCMDDQYSLASSLMVREIVGTLYEFHAVIHVGSLHDGRSYFDEAFQIILEVDHRADLCLSFWALGLWEALLGRYGAALENLENGLRIATEIGHRQWMAANLSALGMVYCYLLAGEEVKHFSEQALALSREVGSKYWTQLAAGTLVKAYLLLGDPAQGQVFLEEEFDDQTPMQTVGNRYFWSRRAEFALAQHEPALALEIVD
ncbi:MAG: tetratricopeptide repeat protein, partial [Anaerolineales bacterium]|nr:tetratricopeptide repeat protein [Anaerolineales bacterium]